MIKNQNQHDDFLHVNNHFLIKCDNSGFLMTSKVFKNSKKRNPDPDPDHFLEESLNNDRSLKIENIYLIQWS